MRTLFNIFSRKDPPVMVIQSASQQQSSLLNEDFWQQTKKRELAQEDVFLCQGEVLRIQFVASKREYGCEDFGIGDFSFAVKILEINGEVKDLDPVVHQFYNPPGAESQIQVIQKALAAFGIYGELKGISPEYAEGIIRLKRLQAKLKQQEG